MINDYTHIALNLLGVIILMVIAVYILKKLKVSKHPNAKQIKIINTVPIGSKERIILVEVNNTVLLLGATPNHIETLYVFNEPEPEHSAVDEYRNPTFAEEMSALK